MINGKDIRKIAMYGAGTIGSGLAAFFALKGLDVVIYVRSDASVERAKPKVENAVNTYVKYGICDSAEDVLARIRYTTDPKEAFTDVMFVQENGKEDIEQKHEMVRIMEEYLPEDAIISSSSTGMPATLIAEGAKHPERIIVSHPFNPAYLIPLMEICAGEETEQKYVDCAVEFFRANDKMPVVMKKEKPGFIANRLAHALWREEVALVSEGVCSIEDADNAIAFGPGLRWNIFGPAMGYELGAGEMGLGEMLRRYAASSNAIFADLSNFSETPAVFPAIAEKEMPDYKADLPDHVGHTIPEIAAFRDAMIVAALRMHKML
ncbi:MAG: 3-hydroxyacyl-CoA dehydrogenase family protein [Oscillospiraceae bacterium]|nr:3-hydroxyacyl-CoA dehydrogenase family protein [Oscillospiraceae bacterium]